MDFEQKYLCDQMNEEILKIDQTFVLYMYLKQVTH